MNREKSKRRMYYNVSLGLIDKILVCILGLILRRVFLGNLGAELSGLSSLFQNIIEFLNLATAGFVTAIYPMLFRANAGDDYDSICKIMKITRRFYCFVTMIIFLLGVGSSFFINYMIYDNQYSMIFLRIVFMIQVLTQCIRMLSSPDVALLSAREQGYYNIIYDIVLNLFIYLGQMVVIIRTKSYLGYLLVALVGYCVYVIALHIQIQKLYPWIRNKVSIQFEKAKSLFSEIKYTVVMQFANFIFCSTDSIVISSAVGLVQVNAYGNYMTIATAILAVYTSFDTAIRNYFGNKLAVDANEQNKKAFLNKVTFVFHFIGTVCAVGYICLISPFIQLWIGGEYVQPKIIDILFGVYIYLTIIYNAVPEYLQILGIFKKDMYSNISSAVLNLVVSVLLVNQLGIAGVLIGTLIGLSLRFFQRTIATFKDVGSGLGRYIRDVFVYIITFTGITFLIFGIYEYLNVPASWINIIIAGGVIVILASCINLIIYGRAINLKAIISKIKS